MNIFELAREAGMLVVLDGRIGGTEYRSVHGTMDAFQRFVHALESALANGGNSDGLSVGAVYARSPTVTSRTFPLVRNEGRLCNGIASIDSSTL